MQRLFHYTFLITLLCVLSQGAIAQNPLEAKRLNQLGLQLLECGNYQKASEYFNYAIQADPSNKLFYNNCAVAYMNMKEYRKAKDMLAIALVIDPHYVKALTNMAIVSFHLLQFAEAYSYYTKALVADSSYTKERFRIDKVIAGVKKVQSENPNNSDVKEILRQLEIIKNTNDATLK
ncbi:MAG: tetratricopeptide repeat protein [Spirochaetes bacterium]|nr:tetratricopeptide repeat protein [Spirochaetota bacterium]